MYKEKVKITSVDVDSNLNLKMPSIFKFFQHISSNHSEVLGVGQKDTIDKNMCWVILRFKVVVYQYPKFNDEITVTTHPGVTNKFLYPRFYQIYDKRGRLMVSASSLWLVLNSETRRVIAKPFGDRKFKGESNKDDIELPEAIKIDEELTKVEDRLVRYNDTDINGHLNNTKYVDFILDVNHKEFYDKHLLKEITISYDKEIKENQIVSIYRNNDRLNQIVKGKIEDNNSFSAKLIFEEVK